MNDVLFVVVVVIALGFDFTNGFHDTANAIATSVGTRALSPRVAVLIASVANLAGAFVTTAVAKNVAKGIIDGNLATQQTVLAALLGAIAWNLLTWWFGLPSSSSHALIGGLVGAALVQSGERGVLWHGLAHKVVIPALLAPPIASAAPQTSWECSTSASTSSPSPRWSRRTARSTSASRTTNDRYTREAPCEIIS